MENIFKYIDYRHFLKDHFSSMKSEHAYFSYRWFAQKAGLSSSGLYQRVVKGERNLTEKTLGQFIVGLGLRGKESDYFRVLVGFNQAKTAQEKQRNYTLMVSMADFVVEHQLEVDEYAYLSQWYYPVLRELVTLGTFEEDYAALAAAVYPPLTARQAKAGVQTLERLNFITRGEEGQYVQKDSAISTGGDQGKVLGLACRSFNRKMLELAQESLDALPVDKRFSTGITMGISESSYEVILQEYEAFRERIVAIVDRDCQPDKVCQMSFQLFPVSAQILSKECE